MKTNKTILSAIAGTTMLLFTTSCSKTFYTKVNNNPDAATVVPLSTLLPGVEMSLAIAQGGDASRYTEMFMQQGYGTAIEPNGYYFYQVAGTNLPAALWANMYESVMENDYALLHQANSAGDNEYAGIANILMAYSMQVTVDFWGNVPYSQAFLGAANIEPSYDNAQTIYGDIIGLLNTGIADLHKAPGSFAPSTDDLIYQGSIKSWIAFAYALEARVYIHQTKTNNAAMCTNAATAADSAVKEGFTTAQIANSWGATANQNPVFQFNSQWGDISYVTSGGSPVTLFDTLAKVSDPRLNYYYDTTGQAAGSIIGLGAYYGLATSPIEFLTTEEVYLIGAEAIVRGANSVNAAAITAYQAAITANFSKLGVSGVATTAYLATPQGTLPGNVAGAIYQIGKQAWECYFLNPEVWSSWRRTGAPALQPTSGTQIPRRMPLPNSEITQNSNAPQGETLWSPRIFWDN